MSERKLNIEDKNYDYFIKEYISNSDSEDLNIYSKILSRKSFFHITNNEHSNHIKILPTSLTKILFLGQLEANEQILFCFYKDELPDKNLSNKEKQKNRNKSKKERDKSNDNITHHKTKLRSAKRNKKKDKEQIEEKKNDEEVVLDVSSPEQLISHKEMKNDIDDVYTNKNTNNFDTELDLLNIKTNEDYIRTDNQNQKYIITLFNNKIKITNDNLKCFYLCLFFCGLLFCIYLLDILIDKNKSFKCLYNLCCFPLSVLLIITGIYGYNKINKKIYDDAICLVLSYSSCASPFINFIFSRISSEDNVRKNIILTILINLFPICFSGLCVYILKELQTKKNKKGLLFEKMNLV